MPLYQNAAGLWVMRYYRDGSKRGARVQETLDKGTTHAEAKRAYNERLGKAGVGSGKALRRPTFERLAAAWEEDHLPNLRSEASRGDAERILAVLVEEFGSTLAPRLTSREVERFRRKQLASGLKPATVNRQMAVFTSVISRAVEWGLIDRHPIPRGAVKKLKEPKEKTDFFTRDEWARFVQILDDEHAFSRHQAKVRRLGPVKEGELPSPGSKHAPTKVRGVRRYGGGMLPGSDASRAYLARLRATLPVFRMLLATASRLSEVLGLKWRDVDFRAGSIVIHQGKTGEEKTLTLSVPIREVLASVPRGTPDALVFQAPDGGPWQKMTVQRAFGTIRDLAELREELTVHTIRHTAASWLAMDGRPLLEIQKILGHKTPAMVLRYAHLQPEHFREALDTLGMTKPGKTSAVPESGSGA